MLKITIFLSLIFIVSLVSSACDSCGSECASSCGTRRFRACCFNYLRKKRGPEIIQIHSLAEDVKESHPKTKVPLFLVEDSPMHEPWTANLFENHPYSLEDMLENRLD